MVRKFQTHSHTFSCQKKKRFYNIKSNEGHGRHDGIKKENSIMNHPECRFNYPNFPMNKTTLILGMSKEISLDEKTQRKNDLKKIKKFLIRQSYNCEKDYKSSFLALKRMTFLEFLYESGMFERSASLDDFTNSEKKKAYDRYINAI